MLACFEAGKQGLFVPLCQLHHTHRHTFYIQLLVFLLTYQSPCQPAFCASLRVLQEPDPASQLVYVLVPALCHDDPAESVDHIFHLLRLLYLLYYGSPFLRKAVALVLQVCLSANLALSSNWLGPCQQVIFWDFTSF